MKTRALVKGPAEIYRTPERAARRVAQLMAVSHGKAMHLGLKDIRELYGQSQLTLAKKAVSNSRRFLDLKNGARLN